MTASEQDPREIVARHRERVLAGRGPEAPQRETDRYKRERPRLGRMPTPLEREMVHLRTQAFRTGNRRPEDASPVDAQTERLEGIWGITTTNTQRVAADEAPRVHALRPVTVAAAALLVALLGRRVLRSVFRR